MAGIPAVFVQYCGVDSIMGVCYGPVVLNAARSSGVPSTRLRGGQRVESPPASRLLKPGFAGLTGIAAATACPRFGSDEPSFIIGAGVGMTGNSVSGCGCARFNAEE